MWPFTSNAKKLQALEAQVQTLSRQNKKTIKLAEQRLTESFDYGFANPLLQLFDGLGANWGAPGLIPGALGTATIGNMFGARYDNRAWGYETFMTEALGDLLRWVSRYRFQTNPIAQGIVRGLKNYTVKTGFNAEVTPRHGQKINKALLKLCQNIIEDFHCRNRMPGWQQDSFVRAIRDGEFFLRIGWSENAGFWLRTVEPEWVRSRDGGMEWQFGCYATREDQENVLGFNVTYDADPTRGEYVPASEMVHYKRNVDKVIRRGISDFFATSDVLVGVQKLLGSTLIGETVRQNLPYIRQYALATQEQATLLAGQNSPGCGLPFVDQDNPNLKFQASSPGAVPNIPEDSIEYKPPPIGDTENAKMAMQAAYECLAVYWQAPSWMTGGDTGNTNFAQALVSESPFSRNIETEQYGFGVAFSEIDEKVLRLAESIGMIPQGTCDKVQVLSYAPSVVVRDTDKETQRNKMLYDNGIITKVTWSNREEVDREMEMELAAANGEDLDNPKIVGGGEGEEESTTPGAKYKQETGKTEK